MTKPELLPCPFCKVSLEDQGWGYYHRVGNPTCPLDDLAWPKGGKSIKNWNTRADLVNRTPPESAKGKRSSQLHAGPINLQELAYDIAGRRCMHTQDVLDVFDDLKDNGYRIVKA